MAITERYLETLSIENAACVMRELAKKSDHNGDPDSALTIVENVTHSINSMLLQEPFAK